MQWLLAEVIGKLRELMNAAHTTYGVDSVVFLVIYVGAGPFFYYSIFRTLRAIKKGLKTELTLWSTMLMAATAAPFVYVLFFGHNMPWWVYVVIGLLIAQGAYTLVRRLVRNRMTAPENVPLTMLENQVEDRAEQLVGDPIPIEGGLGTSLSVGQE